MSLIGGWLWHHVANCDIIFKILHKYNPFGPKSCLETCDVKLIFLLTLFVCPHNYYKDNKQVHLDCSCLKWQSWLGRQYYLRAQYFCLRFSLQSVRMLVCQFMVPIFKPCCKTGYATLIISSIHATSHCHYQADLIHYTGLCHILFTLPE